MEIWTNKADKMAAIVRADLQIQHESTKVETKCFTKNSRLAARAWSMYSTKRRALADCEQVFLHRRKMKVLVLARIAVIQKT